MKTAEDHAAQMIVQLALLIGVTTLYSLALDWKLGVGIGLLALVFSRKG